MPQSFAKVLVSTEILPLLREKSERALFFFRVFGGFILLSLYIVKKKEASSSKKSGKVAKIIFYVAITGR